MLSLVVAAAVAQIGTKAPVMPMAIAPEVQANVLAIETLAYKRDFAGAKSLVRILPKRQLVVSWDDSAVPSALKATMAKTRDAAFGAWTKGVHDLRMMVGTANADIKIGFGATTKWSYGHAAGEPLISATVGLPDKDSLAAVHNDLAKIFGLSLGIAEMPVTTFIVGPKNPAASARLQAHPMEVGLANSILDAADDLRMRVNANRVIEPASASLSTTVSGIKDGPLVQGQPLKWPISVTNRGTGILRFRVIPDCSCFASPQPENVVPGATKTVQIGMDTKEYFGQVAKELYLVSNDAKQPVRIIPVEVQLVARYRILPEKGQVVSSDTASGTFETYLFTPPGHPIRILRSDPMGLTPLIDIQPWKGTLADPANGEGPMPREGYRIRLTLDEIPEGQRVATGLIMATDDPTIPEIRYLMFFQRGILAMPASVFFGEVGSKPVEAVVTLSRPDRPFKITSIETLSKHITITQDSTKPTEYKLRVRFDGKATPGDYTSTIVVKTDDVKQPTVEIRVNASVR